MSAFKLNLAKFHIGTSMQTPHSASHAMPYSCWLSPTWKIHT